MPVTLLATRWTCHRSKLISFGICLPAIFKRPHLFVSISDNELQGWEISDLASDYIQKLMKILYLL